MPSVRATQPAGPAKRRRAPRGSGEQLRSEILAAAKALLAESGRADDVSIRAVADRVQVTPPSIYLHFADKSALLDAVVMDVFEGLDAAMAAEIEAAQTPLERLRGCGRGYIHFALAHPEQYRLAAMDPYPEPLGSDGPLMHAAFARLTAVIGECMAAGILAPGDVRSIALDLWAAAHGIASLMIAKPYVEWGDVDTVIDRVLTVAALGHIALDHVGEDRSPAAIVAWLSQLKR